MMTLPPERVSLGPWAVFSNAAWFTLYERRLIRHVLGPAVTAGAVVGAACGWWWTRTTDEVD